MDNQFELLSKLVQRSSVTIDFEDLSYTVQNGNKKILRNVSGSFRAGDLTVILGPSGSGKTTLLNILAGYVTAGVTGQIKINERARKMKSFHKLSTYIMQEDLLQTNLTVEESMMIAIDLKLGTELFQSYGGCELRELYSIKMKLIDEVLLGLGLSNCRKIRTENLSGGQKRRLSIALELTNNPPVIFLDEPTTGLDIVAIKQCVRLLQFLSRQGRTVICTIHQPTASMFELFDQVYFIANGYSIYNGDPLKLVPFLAAENLQCPTTYNPADYLLELVQNSEIGIIRKLQNRNQNGTLTKFRKNQSNRSLNSIIDNFNSIEISYSKSEKCLNSPFPTNFRTQFRILSKRMFLQSLRNKQILFLQFFHHIISALLIGCAFYGIGNNANNALLNFKFCLSVVVFFMYTHIMIPVLLFPMEFKLLRREYFNRWYGLKAFYFARTISSIPSLIVFGAMFTTITYLLTYQPLELYRYGMFLFFATMISICSEGLGIAVGSIFSITNGSIVGPASITPLLALCTYGIGYGQSIEPLMQFLMALSYLRYGLVGFLQALYGSERTILECDYNEDLYCHYRNPKTILRDLGMDNQSVTGQITGLFFILLFYRILAYCFLRYRLTAEFSRKIYYYATKIFQH